MSKFVIPRLSHNRKTPILLFDYETTGLSLILARPWQLAFNISKGGKIIKEEEHYIWWDNLQMPEYLKKKIHFDEAKYRRLAKPADEVFEIFEKYLYDPEYLIAGHNIIGYDLGVHYSASKVLGRWKGWSFMDRVIDTLCLARHLHNGTKPSADNFLGDCMKEIGRPPRGAKKANLGALCKEFGIEFSDQDAHDAKYDIEKNVEVLNKLIYALDI